MSEGDVQKYGANLWYLFFFMCLCIILLLFKCPTTVSFWMRKRKKKPKFLYISKFFREQEIISLGMLMFILGIANLFLCTGSLNYGYIFIHP